MSQTFLRRTPETEALQQEQAATSVMDQQAAEQDFIAKQQKEAEKAQRLAEAAAKKVAAQQRQQIAAAKNAGVKIQTDATTGQDTMARHEDGAPLYESGFTSEPQQTDKGPMVEYRDPRGIKHPVPLDKVNRTTDPTGSPFYEFTLPTGERVRQPEDKAKPLFKVDPNTGYRYTEAPDTKTGSYTQTPLGLDRDAAAKAAIEKRKAAAKQQEDERSFKASELRLMQDQQQIALRPVKDRLDLAAEAFDKLDKAKIRYEKRPEGIVAIQKFGDEEIASPIDTADAPRLSSAQAWIEQHNRAKQELEAAKAAHDPLAAEIQKMDEQRAKLAIDTLQANRREALELDYMEKAAKAGVPVYEPQWKRAIAAARKDPRLVDIYTKAGLYDQGSPLADDVERVSLPETGKLIGKMLDRRTDKGLQPGQGVLKPGTAATPLARPQPTLKDTILESLAADNTPATGKSAQALATESLGITDPDKWSVATNEQGTHDLSRDGQLVGTVDTRNNQIRLFPPTSWEQENEQVRITQANKDGLPIYYMGGGQPMRPQELRDYIQSGFDIAGTTKDPVELETKLAAAGLSPDAIRRNVLDGRLSVQDGRMLAEKFHGIQQVDTTEAGTRKAFGEWLTKPENRTQAAMFQNGDAAQKADVVSSFFDQHASQAATGNLLPNREGLAAQREAMLKPYTEKGVLAKAGGFVKELIMPMIGIGAQATALPFQEALHLFGAETEAGKLSNEEFSNWLKRSSGFLHRINTRNELDRPLGDLEAWMNKANPGDEVPQELADKIAAAAFDTYHQLTPDAAKDLNTTRDTFDVNKDPALRGIVQNYLQTANPSARASLLGMLTMDAKDRETQKKVMAYIEAPRTATAGEAQERAALAGVTLTPEKAGQVLAIGQQIEKADTPAKVQNLVKQAGGVMGLSNPADIKTALDLITRKTTTSPDSAFGLLKGGFVAGRQELATEALTTAAEAGVGFLTAGAATPEILAERAARQGIVSGARAALRRTLTAGLNALSNERKLFAAARGRIGQARRALGADLTKQADEFAKLGIVQPKFGAPLTTSQKARNIAVAGVKAGAVDAPMEGLEEGFAAIGETDPNLDSLVQQIGMGAAGGMVLGPLFTGGGVAAQAWKNRGLEARMGDLKTKWAEDFNRNMAGVAGFKPMRPEDFDVAMGVMNTPEHAAARDEYVNALAELQAAAQEQAASPASRLREVQARLTEIEKQHGPRERPIGGIVANGMEALRIETAEEKRLLAEQAKLTDDPASIQGSKSPRLMAAEARIQKAGNDLAAASTFAFEAADELRQLPADQQPLYTGIAKAMSGAREFTEAEAKALIGLQGENAVAFQQAMPADVAGPPSSTRTAPNVTQTGPGRYTLPEGVNIAVPPQAVAQLAERAPSLTGALGRSQAVPQTQAQVAGGGTAPATNPAPAPAAKPTKNTKSTKTASPWATASEATPVDGLWQSQNGDIPVRIVGVMGVDPATGETFLASQDASGKITGLPAKEVMLVKASTPKAKKTPPAANTGAQTEPPAKQLTPKAHENIARQVIGTVAAKSAKLKKLIKESKQPSTMQSGGMWTGLDGTIVFHLPTLVQQLAGLDAKTAAQRVEAILDEEIRHSANLEAARRLYERGDTNPLNLPFEQWREAWYGDIWNNHFTDAMRQQVKDAYGDTLPKEDWMRAMEGLRMLDQLRATGSITESVLRHLEAVLQALREFLAAATPKIKAEIQAIQAILIEFGYEQGAVKPEKAKKKARQPKAKQPKANPPQPVIGIGSIVRSDAYRSEGDIRIESEQQPANKDHLSPWYRASTTGGRTFELEQRFITQVVPTSQAIPPATTQTTNEKEQTQAQGQRQEVLTPAPETAPEAQPGSPASDGAADGDAGDQALADAFKGLFSAPAPTLTQADPPKERRDAMMKAASVLVDVGVKTPLELAQRLEKLAPNGALRQYSRAFWRLMTGFDSTLEESPDWQAVYAELDRPMTQPMPNESLAEVDPATSATYTPAQREADRVRRIESEQRVLEASAKADQAQQRREELLPRLGTGWQLSGNTISKSGFGHWTEQERDEVRQRFREAGIRSNVSAPDGNSTRKSSFTIQTSDASKLAEEIFAAEQTIRESERQQKIADEEKKTSQELAQIDSVALQWMTSLFQREDFANAYNKVRLSDFVTGKTAKFTGMVNPRWLDGVQAANAVLEGGKVDFAALKEHFEKFKADNSSSSAKAEVPERGDTVTWTDGAGKEAVSMIDQITNNADGTPVAWVEWFGVKSIPLDQLTLKTKSSQRLNREHREAEAAAKAGIPTKEVTTPEPVKEKKPADNKALKEMKRFLLEKLDEAIAEAPDGRITPSAYSGRVVIEIPGDGTFTLVNEKKVLQEFAKRAKSFPTTTPSATYPKPTAIRPSSIPALNKAKLSKMDMVKVAGTFASTDETRMNIMQVVDVGDTLVATNGKYLFMAPFEGQGTAEDPMLYTAKGGQIGPQSKHEEDFGKYPDWKVVVPKDTQVLHTGIDTGRLWQILKQASAVFRDVNFQVKNGSGTFDDAAPYVDLLLNPDGSVAVVGEVSNDSGAASNLDRYEHNLQEGAQSIGRFDASLFMDILAAMRALGQEKVSFRSEADMSQGALVVSSPVADVILMRVRTQEATNAANVEAAQAAMTPAEETTAAPVEWPTESRNLTLADTARAAEMTDEEIEAAATPVLEALRELEAPSGVDQAGIAKRGGSVYDEALEGKFSIKELAAAHVWLRRHNAYSVLMDSMEYAIARDSSNDAPAAPKASGLRTQADTIHAGRSPAELLALAAPYEQQGPDYNRNIAESAARLRQSVERGDKFVQYNADELAVRLEKWAPEAQQATKVSNDTKPASPETPVNPSAERLRRIKNVIANAKLQPYQRSHFNGLATQNANSDFDTNAFIQRIEQESAANANRDDATTDIPDTAVQTTDDAQTFTQEQAVAELAKRGITLEQESTKTGKTVWRIEQADMRRFSSDLNDTGVAYVNSDRYAIKQANDGTYYVERTRNGQREELATGFADIAAANRDALEIVSGASTTAPSIIPPTPAQERILAQLPTAEANEAQKKGLGFDRPQTTSHRLPNDPVIYMDRQGEKRLGYIDTDGKPHMLSVEESEAKRQQIAEFEAQQKQQLEQRLNAMRENARAQDEKRLFQPTPSGPAYYRKGGQWFEHGTDRLVGRKKGDGSVLLTLDGPNVNLYEVRIVSDNGAMHFAPVSNDTKGKIVADAIPSREADAWTRLSDNDLPRLDPDMAEYTKWRLDVADKAIPNGTLLEKAALALELANAISLENAKPDLATWQHSIVAMRVAGQLLTGERNDIISKAKARALTDEYSQWFMGGMFEGGSVSEAAFDANAAGRPIPQGFERKNGKIQPITSTPEPVETTGVSTPAKNADDVRAGKRVAVAEMMEGETQAVKGKREIVRVEPAPFSGLISDEESARLDAVTAQNTERFVKLSTNQLSQLAIELGVRPMVFQRKGTEQGELLDKTHPDDLKAALDVVTKAKADTPATAEAKVEEQVQTVAATEGQRDAKEIKTDIMAALEKALSERDPAKVKLVTFQIPGDGTFKIYDSAENIKTLMARVKRLPTQITPESAPSVPNATNLQGLANAVERAGDSGDILAWVTNAANADEWAMKVVAAVRAKNAGLVQRAENRLAERTAERTADTPPAEPSPPEASESKVKGFRRLLPDEIRGIKEIAMNRFGVDPDALQRIRDKVGSDLTPSQAADVAVEFVQQARERGEMALIGDALADQPEWAYRDAWKAINEATPEAALEEARASVASPADSGLASAPRYQSPPGLADTAQRLKGTTAAPHLVGTIIQKAYAGVQRGRSSVMVPIRAVFMVAKAAHPEITPDAFMAEIRAADERGDIMVEAPERPETIQQAGPFVVRNALGVPSTNMMVVEQGGGGANGDSGNGGNRPPTTHIMPDGYELTGPGLHGLASAPIRAHHGTPHKVDRFRLDKIGTGEGAQAYGWGLYFAEVQKVAENYRFDERAISIRGESINSFISNRPSSLSKLAKDRGVSIEEARAEWDAMLPELRVANAIQSYQSPQSVETMLAGYPDALERFRTMQRNGEIQWGGNLYTVELLPDEDEFISWDDPISKQSSVFERGPNRIARNLQFLADFTEGKTITPQLLRSLNIPTYAKMLSSMFGAAQYLQIDNAIVGFVPVDVVDFLATKQLSPQMLLHDEAMLANLLSGSSADINIPAWMDTSSSAAYSVANEIAEKTGASGLAGLSEKLRAASKTGALDLHKSIIAKLGQNATGEGFYLSLASSLGQGGRDANGLQAASKHLSSLGIPGIKYLDGNSRDNGKGTRNYVIFDENLVRILEENGKPVAEAGGGLASAPAPSPASRVTPEMDAEYMAAVEAGDMEKVQRMVDEAAKVAIDSNPRNVVKFGRFLSKSEYESVREQIEELPRDVFYVGNVEVIRNPTGGDIRGMTNEERSARGGRRSVDPDTRFTKDRYGNTWRWKATGGMHSMIEPSISRREGVDVNQNNDIPYHSDLVKDAIRSGEYIPSKTLAEYPNYADFVKPSSADPVTYDEAGNVIPLSQRFNPQSDSILYSAPAPKPNRAEAIVRNLTPKEQAGKLNPNERAALEEARRSLEAPLASAPTHSTASGMASDSGAAQANEPSPGGLTEAEVGEQVRKLRYQQKDLKRQADDADKDADKISDSPEEVWKQIQGRKRTPARPSWVRLADLQQHFPEHPLTLKAKEAELKRQEAQSYRDKARELAAQSDLLRKTNLTPLAYHTNEYGDVPIGVARAQPTLEHFPGKNIQATARAAGIDFRVGFAGFDNGRPVKDGIVVASENADTLRAALGKREERKAAANTPEAIARRQERERMSAIERRRVEEEERQQKLHRYERLALKLFPGMPEKDARSLARHASDPDYTGVLSNGEDMSEEDAMRKAVWAHIRHQHTGYDSMFGDGLQKEDNRPMVRRQIEEIYEEWKLPPQNDEAAEVSQGGFQKQESSPGGLSDWRQVQWIKVPRQLRKNWSTTEREHALLGVEFPKGWEINNFTDSKGGSVYYEFDTVTGKRIRVSIRDHAVSSFREQEFGNVDLVVRVPDARTRIKAKWSEMADSVTNAIWQWLRENPAEYRTDVPERSGSAPVSGMVSGAQETSPSSAAVNPESSRAEGGTSGLASAPVPNRDAAKAKAIKEAIATMPPMWREALELSMKGTTPQDIATRMKLSETAVGNILRTAQGRLRILLEAGEGKLRPEVKVQDDKVKAASGRPDLAMSGNALMAALDQNIGNAEVIHRAEMRELAQTMFLGWPAESLALVKRWMDSGGIMLSPQNLPDGLRRIIEEASARGAGDMLMQAAANHALNEARFNNAPMIEQAALGMAQRFNGSVQARAFGMRQDTIHDPMERHALYIQKALLSPSDEMERALKKNPEKRERYLAQLVADAEAMKKHLKGLGMDIDAWFDELKEIKQEGDALIPQAAQKPLARLPEKQREGIKAVLQGATWAEAAASANLPVGELIGAYKAFFDSVNRMGVEAAQAAKNAALASAPVLSFAEQIGLPPPPTGTIDPNSRLVDTAKTRQYQSKKAKAALSNPKKVAAAIQETTAGRSGWLSKASEYWRMSILTGPQTWVVNASSGVAFGFYRHLVQKLGSAGLSGMARMIGVKDMEDAPALSDMPHIIKAAIEAWKPSLRLALRSMRHNARLFNMYAKGTLKVDPGDEKWDAKEAGLTVNEQGNYANEKFAPALSREHWFGKIMDGLSFRILLLADEFVRSFFGRIEMAGQARQLARSEPRLRARAVKLEAEARALLTAKNYTLKWSASDGHYYATQQVQRDGETTTERVPWAEWRKVLPDTMRESLAIMGRDLFLHGGLDAMLSTTDGAALEKRIQQLTDPNSVAWHRAVEGANAITFQNEIGEGKRLIDGLDAFAKIIMDAKKGKYGWVKHPANFIFPFVATPLNIFKTGVTMSPVGGLFAVMDAVRAYRLRKQGGLEQADKIMNAQRGLEEMVNQIVAWGLVLVIADMVEPGEDDEGLPLMTGTTPYTITSQGEREIMYRTAPPQSIRLFGRWFSYARLDPFGSVLANIADSVLALRSEQPSDAALGELGMKMVQSIKDKTFLQGLSDVLNAVQDPKRFFPRWFTNITTGFIPNLIRQPIRSADPLIRENDLPNDMGFWESFGRRVGYSVVPQAAMPAVDVWGRDESKNTGMGGPASDFVMRLLWPGQTRDTEGVDYLDVALMRYNMTHDKPFGVTAPSREIQKTINGKPVRVSLDDAEYDDMARKAGKAARAAIGDRFKGRDLTENDVELIKDIISRSQGVYRDAAFTSAFQKRGLAATSK